MERQEQRAAEHKPNYLGVFIALALLTGLEVLVTYLPVPQVPILVPLAILKAALVALFYMHLRYDRRVFSVMFIFGLVMGGMLLLSLVVLFLFGFNQFGA